MPRSAVTVAKTPGRRRAGVAVFAAIIAFSAYAGAVGLVSGGLSLGELLTARLPFASPMLGGIALALIVAAPTTWLPGWPGRGMHGRTRWHWSSGS